MVEDQPELIDLELVRDVVLGGRHRPTVHPRSCVAAMRHLNIECLDVDRGHRDLGGVAYLEGESADRE